ncbi:hypothetical protein GCM10007368_31850 [Isoptericola cucumis]|uniref:Uncharacterized protein n=1 Tax=Isoptericola cucumis TaxID=1776856 RepID=A0ABQ2BB38_9MICO|nr:hypothetical protein GCM10007368_31850 [Isoptericola cucumis]
MMRASAGPVHEMSCLDRRAPRRTRRHPRAGGLRGLQDIRRLTSVLNRDRFDTEPLACDHDVSGNDAVAATDPEGTHQ